ncbi:MAG TPA: GNAT family N-acetyltransferase [Candidatus Lokiarchaeia archaeon]
MTEFNKDFKKIRLRSFFLNREKKSEKTEKKEDFDKKLEEVGMEYIQMKLSLKNITPEYESEIKKKVENNLLNAKIRRASENDLNTTVEIYNRSWLTSNEPFAPLSHESIKVLFDDPDIVILIAKVYGIDAGFIIIDIEGKRKEYGVIAGLAVIPRFQRKGLGKILGLAGWNYLKNKGIKELRCEVYPDNKVSYNFIKSLGFEEFDRKYYTAENFLRTNKT